jgi:hypothetical protein
MRTDIYFRDITKTENLEWYLSEKVERGIEDFFKYDSGAHLTVRVEYDRRRSQSRKPSFICEVVLKPTKNRAIIKVRKTDANFNTCVARTVAALKVILSKRSSLKSQHGRHDAIFSQVA